MTLTIYDHVRKRDSYENMFVLIDIHKVNAFMKNGNSVRGAEVLGIIFKKLQKMYILLQQVV